MKRLRLRRVLSFVIPGLAGALGWYLFLLGLAGWQGDFFGRHEELLLFPMDQLRESLLRGAIATGVALKDLPGDRFPESLYLLLFGLWFLFWTCVFAAAVALARRRRE